MRSTTFAATAALLSTLVAGQTFTDCQPLEKKCPPDPALGTTLTTDFTKGKSSNWELAEGTTLTYDPELGAEFVISKGEAPTIGLSKYIMFGKVEVVMRASAGQGTVSSFILESSDLDEIDWEWLGADHANVQTNFFGKGNTTTYDRGQYHAISDPVTTFHTYTIDWTAESTKWYINGDLVRTLKYGDALALGGKNYPQTPMKVKMGSWIGCASAEAAADPKTKYTCEWAGGPIDLSAGPYTMYVKSVKVQDYGCASEYTYSDKSGSWESIVASGECNGEKVDSSSKPSSSGASKTTSKPASSTSSAAILIETKNSLNTTSTGVVTKSALSNATTTATGSATLTGSASTTTTPAQVSDNAASSMLPSKRYGGLDIAVAALGLGMGYLFM